MPVKSQCDYWEIVSDDYVIWPREFLLYDLKIHIVATPSKKQNISKADTLFQAKIGSYFIVLGENIFMQEGCPFSFYDLWVILPLLSGYQRVHSAYDWMATDMDIAAPDPHCGYFFRITRLGIRKFCHEETTNNALVS